MGLVQISINWKMKKNPNYKFINQIQDLIPFYEFEQIESKLLTIRKEYRKSFLSLIYAGYSVNTAFRNHQIFYEFVKHNYISYSLGIRLITKTADKREVGLVIDNLTVYELN